MTADSPLGAAVRDAAVAGMFYPGEAAALSRTVQSLFDAVEHQPSPVPKAVILPHAGYIYSGQAAASALAPLTSARERIRRVLMVGPAHRVFVEGMALPASGGFATPLGIVPVDRAAIESALDLPAVGISDQAHRDEHSLEVQLPLLQHVLGEFSIVPVLVGRARPRDVARVIDALWGGPETLVVISSDLSHFLDCDTARKVDRATCDAILARRSDLNGKQACGAYAINGLMTSDKAADLSIHNVALCNSWDTARRNRERVVGYASFVLH